MPKKDSKSCVDIRSSRSKSSSGGREIQSAGKLVESNDDAPHKVTDKNELAVLLDPGAAVANVKEEPIEKIKERADELFN